MISKRRMWLFLIFGLIILLLIGMAIPAFAQGEAEAVANPIKEFFEWIGNFTKSNINNSDLEQEKINQISNVTDSGVTVAERAVDLWLGFHELIINTIFAGSPVKFDVGIAVMIAFVVGTALVFMFLWKFIKHAWKWIILIVAFIAFIMILGIQAPSI